MTISYDREILVNVIVYHWATKTSGCGCGWAELGKSYAEHVATVYEQSISMKDTIIIEDSRHQHATCACVYPRGQYPLKTLCGITISNNRITLPKCPACVEIFGKPCVLCPPDCKGC